MSFPVGTITFLFSDIEGSTRLGEKHPVSMAASIARHDAIMHAAMKQQCGYVFKTAADAFCVAFDTAASAVEAAVESQRTLHSEPWGDTGPLRARMAIHTGAAEFRDGDYFGNPLNRAARILAAAHGGQVLLSLPVQELVRDAMPAEVALRDLGERRLRDLARPERLFQILVDGHPMEFPPLRSLEVMPNNLPGNLNSFVDREREMQHVRDMLRGGGSNAHGQRRHRKNPPRGRTQWHGKRREGSRRQRGKQTAKRGKSRDLPFLWKQMDYRLPAPGLARSCLSSNDAAIAAGRNLAISDALDYARGLHPTSMNPA